MRITVAFLLVMGMLAMLGCKSKPQTETGMDTAQTETRGETVESMKDASSSDTTPPGMARATADTVTTPSGLRYSDIKVGDGSMPEVGQTVSVHYTGWLLNGEQVDSSRDKNRPYVFTVGRGQVVKGLDEGVATMKPGGLRKLIIPAELGYGASGRGPIPPNATLIFDVELLEIK